MAGRIPHADTSKGNGFRRLVDSICRKMFVGTDRTEERGHIAVADALSIAPAPRNPPTDSGPFRSIIWRNFRSEEHTSELQSLMRISYAVFCLKKKTTKQAH